MNDNIINLEEQRPHVVQEVVCLKCLNRWIAVAPEKLLLKQYECKKCGQGFVIKTGEVNGFS